MLPKVGAIGGGGLGTGASRGRWDAASRSRGLDDRLDQFLASTMSGELPSVITTFVFGDVARASNA